MTVALEKPLSTALREETARAHTEAEGSDYLARLMAGEVSLQSLADFSGQLWFIYEALERAVRAVSQTPVGSLVADPRLERQEALETDLAELIGGDWREKVRILPATAAYVARLEEIADANNAVRVVAHHYVRYMGDISGGQVISRQLKAQYGLSEGALNFYDFSALGKIPPYRSSYRQRLDDLPLSESEREGLIGEAKRAFAFNADVFAALSGNA